MFLFLSKLLPLFIYPLGISCLLLIAALIIIWRRPKWAAGLISGALIILFFFSNYWVSSALIRYLEWQNIPEGELPNASAIVVLGGAILPKVPPRPWVEVGEEGDRILYGAKLYRDGKAPKLILSGGRIDWNNTGASESKDMAELAQVMGVPKTAILEDPTSLNTYENAVNVRKILDSQGIERRVLLVTSAIHLPRSLAIFKRQGIDAIPAPTDFITIDQGVEEFTWQEAMLKFFPDAGRLAYSTRALKEYIGLVVYRLRGWL